MFQLAGFLDDRSDLQGSTVAGFPVLGKVSELGKFPRTEFQVVCAFGSPSLVRQMSNVVTEFGFTFATIICRDSSISSTVSIGPGSLIFPQVAINRDVTIGECVTVNVGSTISHDTIVERYSNINPGASLAGNVRVGEGSFIGMGANVIQGVTIGHAVVVGAGAVVIDNVRPEVTVVGVPAKVNKRN